MVSRITLYIFHNFDSDSRFSSLVWDQLFSKIETPVRNILADTINPGTGGLMLIVKVIFISLQT